MTPIEKSLIRQEILAVDTKIIKTKVLLEQEPCDHHASLVNFNSLNGELNTLLKEKNVLLQFLK